MKMQMQYPNIQGNQLCDGRIHNIKPSKLSRIDGFELYLLEYFDETYGSQCSTILIKTKDGFKKVPLLDYNLLFEMLENGQLDLIPVDISELMNDRSPLNEANDRSLLIEAEDSKRNITALLMQMRAAIIIFIGEYGGLYINIRNNYEKINSQQLIEFMEKYDIQWRYTNNLLASQGAIDSAISGYLGHIEGLDVKDRYQSENIHHYSVAFFYKDERGNTRMR